MQRESFLPILELGKAKAGIQMTALKLETTIDEVAVQALPKLRPFLGKRVELTVALAGTPTEPKPRLSFEDLLARRVDAPKGSKSLTDDDIDRAIAQGACGEDLARYRAGGADLSDFIILETAREQRAFPVATFDVRFSREDGAELVI